MSEPMYIHLNGEPVAPSFRVPRGEVKITFDDFTLLNIMHPYDIVQKLAEEGNISQAFAALDGFMKREIEIKAQTAIDKMYWGSVD